MCKICAPDVTDAVGWTVLSRRGKVSAGSLGSSFRAALWHLPGERAARGVLLCPFGAATS